MGITVIVPTLMVKDESDEITAGVGTAINTGNTMTILYPKNGKLLIVIDSNHADTAATVAISDYFTGEGQGTKTIAVPDTEIHMFIVGDSARYKTKAGIISISWAANSAGFLHAFDLPVET